jgi:hypothetical protein
LFSDLASENTEQLASLVSVLKKKKQKPCHQVLSSTGYPSLFLDHLSSRCNPTYIVTVFLGHQPSFLYRQYGNRSGAVVTTYGLLQQISRKSYISGYYRNGDRSRRRRCRRRHHHHHHHHAVGDFYVQVTEGL